MAFLRLSEREKISLMMMRGWGDRQRSYNQVRELFNETFRNGDGQPLISKSTISETIRRFEQTGSLKHRAITGRPRSTTSEDNRMEIAQAFVENPHLTVRKASEQHVLPRSTVHRILKSIKFHPYKVNLIHELNEDDPDRRIEFCDTMMTRIDEDPNFLYSIVFSDESTFTLNGEVNRHNCRYWSDSNPHWTRDEHTQYLQKLNVWAGIVNNQLVGPYFIDGDLNAVKYEAMLRGQIIPRIREIVGDNFNHTWFQQDGAPAHYGRNVRALLDLEFHHRWIGRRGEIEWPARSPDLSPLDFFYGDILRVKCTKLSQII